MPVRDRKYENILQFIFGGLIALGIVGELLRRAALWCMAHFHHIRPH